jgi:ribonucleoside-diphosphate reductase alpha chain
VWKQNTEEERLLGVSLTGIFDNKNMVGKGVYQLGNLLPDLRREAIVTNEKYSKNIGIPQSTAITCVKPSGTVSQLVDSASGIHPRYSEYYIRRVRGDIKDPLTQFLMDSGIPHEPDVMNPENMMVFSFPQKAPTSYKQDLTALEHLELWLAYQEFWCEHKPSITVSVAEDEWMSVGAWVYDHFDQVSGISFLPKSDHTYRQAPYESITREEYDVLVKESPKRIEWERLAEYELEDNTESSQTFACTSDACEVVDIKG